MSSQHLHDKLIAETARQHLGPLGFQRKGRSRLWFADHGWWLAVVDFQPSGWSRGTYLNVAAKWLWRGDGVWSFDSTLHPTARVADFVELESETQFREAVLRVAKIAAVEADRLREAFRNIHTTADHLSARARERGGPWDFYNAGIAAFLAGRSDEAAGYLRDLSVPRPTDPPGADWLEELRATAGTLAGMCHDRPRLSAHLTDQLHRSRDAFHLTACAQGLPGASIHAV